MIINFFNKIVWLSFNDLISRFKRNYLGPLWLPMIIFIGSLTMASVWSYFLKLDFIEMAMRIAVGLTIWTTISNIIIESSGLYYAYRDLILNQKINYLILNILLVTRWTIYSFISLLIIIIFSILFGFELSINNLLLGIFGFFSLFLGNIYISLIISRLGVIIPDITHLISILMPIFFFLTPIIWDSDMLEGHKYSNYFHYNFFSVLVNLIKIPFLNHEGAISNLIYFYIFLSIMVIINKFFSKLIDNKIPYLI